MPKKKNQQQQQQQQAPVDPTTGETFHLDEAKAFEKFKHYDADNNGYLDPKETLALSVDLYHAFNPGKTLTDEQMKVMSHKLMERLDQKSGDDNGVLSFAEFLPWYAQAAEKHWKMVHHIHDQKPPKDDDHLPAAGSGLASPEPKLQPVRLGTGTPVQMGTSPGTVNLPMPSEIVPSTPATAGENPGFVASTTMRPTEAPEKLDDGSVRVSTLDQAVKVILENRERVLVARRLNLRDEGAVKVAQAMMKNTVLEEIYLSQNNIGPRGAKELAAAIAVHPTLAEVYMGYNVVQDAGAMELVAAGGKSKTVRVMDVDYGGLQQTSVEPKDGNIEAVCDYFNGDMAPPPDMDSPGRLSQMLC